MLSSTIPPTRLVQPMHYPTTVLTNYRTIAPSHYRTTAGFNMKPLVALVGALGILGLAWWFDRLYELSRLEAARTFDANPYAIVGTLAIVQLVLAGLLFLLAWFVILKSGGNTFVFLMFLLVGLLLLFSFSLDALLSRLPSFLSLSLTVFLPISPRSMLFEASAFTTLIGIIGLIAQRRPSLGR